MRAWGTVASTTPSTIRKALPDGEPQPGRRGGVAADGDGIDEACVASGTGELTMESTVAAMDVRSVGLRAAAAVEAAEARAWVDSLLRRAGAPPAVRPHALRETLRRRGSGRAQLLAQT